MNGTNNESKKIAVMANDITYIKKEIDSLNKSIKCLDDNFEKHYVTRIEFEPVKKVVYGLVGIALITLFTALITTVVI